MTAPMITVATDCVRIVRELRELIVALDRRVPQVHRMGELAIVHAAATEVRRYGASMAGSR